MKQHKIKLLELAMFYEKVLSDDQVQLYGKYLYEKLTVQELDQAIRLYFDNPQNEFFPQPISKLVALIKNPIQDQDMANEVASKLCSALSKYGPDSWERARDYIGELGWLVASKLGGWSYLCQTLTNSEMQIFRAQARDLAKTQIALARANRLHTPIEIPNQANGNGPTIEKRKSDGGLAYSPDPKTDSEASGTFSKISDIVPKLRKD